MRIPNPKYFTLGIALLALGISVLAFLHSAPGADASFSRASASAGLFGTCDVSTNTVAISRSFNNVNAKPITMSADGAPGGYHPCIITFPFKIGSRVVVATIDNTDPRFIAVERGNGGELKTNQIRIWFFAYDQSLSGDRFDLLVY